MWKIKHIFDGDYGCEETDTYDMVSVSLVNDMSEEKILSVSDKWLTENNLDVGSEWPEQI